MPSGVKFACSSNICCEHVFFYVGLKHEKRGQTGPDDGSNPETDATVLTVRLRERLNMKIHRFLPRLERHRAAIQYSVCP